MSKKEKVYTVIEITRLIKASLEKDFSNVWIEGEISNMKMPKSGHVYLTIKDEHSQIQAVKFNASFDPVFKNLKDGDKVRVFGNIGVYERSGQYQVYIRGIEKLGLGDLQLRFNKLKEKLKVEGLFDKKFKKQVPMLPQRIGIVTSPTGAAIRDILGVLGRRFSNVHVLLFPVKVQGEGAGDEIANAIDDLNTMKEIDVIIVGRGGGSIEDLWAFNEETVARAIFRSSIPVVSAVGHEIDYTIADFTADLRAETPTAAAELVLEKKDGLTDSVRWLKERLYQAVMTPLRDYRSKLQRCVDHYALKAPENLTYQYRQNVDESEWRLKKVFTERIKLIKSRLKSEKEKIRALNPLNILSRGYSITQDFHTKKILKNVKCITKDMRLRTVLANGEVISVVEKKK